VPGACAVSLRSSLLTAPAVAAECEDLVTEGNEVQGERSGIFPVERVAAARIHVEARVRDGRVKGQLIVQAEERVTIPPGDQRRCRDQGEVC
jgi:hypothetical protein